MKEGVESGEEDEKNKLEGATWVVKCLSCLLSPLFHRDSTLERWIWNGSKPKSQPGHQLA